MHNAWRVLLEGCWIQWQCSGWHPQPQTNNVNVPTVVCDDHEGRIHLPCSCKLNGKPGCVLCLRACEDRSLALHRHRKLRSAANKGE